MSRLSRRLLIASAIAALPSCDTPEKLIVEKLIASGANPAGLMPGGEKILPWCIRNGRLAFVRYMFKHGADPHITDHAGNPLLHIAISAGHRDLVHTLIEMGADPGATDPEGRFFPKNPLTAKMILPNGMQSHMSAETAKLATDTEENEPIETDPPEPGPEP